MTGTSGPPPLKLRRASDWRGGKGDGKRIHRADRVGAGAGHPDLVGVDAEQRERRGSGDRSKRVDSRSGTIGHTTDTPLPPCFCACRGNKGVTGECRRCRGMIGVRRDWKPKKRRKNKKKGRKWSGI